MTAEISRRVPALTTVPPCQIPAVCMVLVQADFTCAYPEWEQQAASIERDVALTRECLGGHPTRLVLACIQIEGSTPTTSPRRSDAQRSERLGAICRQLEMSSRALLLVPSPHLRQGEPTGPMINMADTVAVAASEFYAEEAKRRAQLCSLVPHSQKAASARCEAKVAFFLDMAADASAAAAYERAIDTLTDLWAEVRPYTPTMLPPAVACSGSHAVCHPWPQPEQCSPGTLVGRLEAAGLAGLLTTRVCALYLATGSTAGATAAHARLMRAFQPAARPQSAVEWAAVRAQTDGMHHSLTSLPPSSCVRRPSDGRGAPTSTLASGRSCRRLPTSPLWARARGRYHARTTSQPAAHCVAPRPRGAPSRRRSRRQRPTTWPSGHRR